MQIKTTGLVLSTVKYSEADLIVSIFTKEKGLVSFFLKGIRKAKRSKLKSSQFQLLSCLALDFTYRDNKSMQFIKEAKTHISLQNLQQNIYKSTMCMFLAEVLKLSIQEEEQNIALYQFLENSLQSLDQASTYADFHLQFLVELTRFLGFYPEINHNDYAYFNLLEGAFQSEELSKYVISGSNVQILEQCLNSSDLFSSLRIHQKKRQDFLDMLLYYYEIHLDGFRIPKSKAILEQVFA
ncbi:DNA repair protein RecO [Psychroflexus sp. ALD_RP9]|uniref:DNA repair protein RecO n=1 Tax=Psychroflexus sp. ALD_RP9 TaxID=2777186 RepID=UPI001A8E59B6|nr:DNA repair protein RecO [Psychroflexus sp. ALD_RP9]QSS98267.1 DNA repair protein RecO [Psychroflexus sp. ALD_RP9]